MNILVTGARGLLGRSLSTLLESRGHTVIGWDVQELDITDYSATFHAITQAAPEAVIHCAALTNVDFCAQNPDEALRVNGYGTANVALACAALDCPILYISTNEVFDGERATPYLEFDPTRPINPYGYSKWHGEQAIQRYAPKHYIARISWLFGHGGSNFLQKIVAAAQQGKPIKVVTNEVAAPTYTDDLSDALEKLITSGRYGIYHLVNEGGVSRYGFARHILDCAGYSETPITPILGAMFPRPSRPPTYATLRNVSAAHLGIRLRSWQEAVNAYFEKERLTV
jgi:dTDP-4-dehydrorhamnose reductase